jgi:hypothetical protein
LFTYTISDAGGKTSVGQVRVRANLRSTFKGAALAQSPVGAAPAVSLDSLLLNVAPTGRFGGTLKVNGKVVPLAGTFDYTDSVQLSRRMRLTGDVVTVRLSITNAGDKRQLNYEIGVLGQTFTGSLSAL